jgi:hypothetical protein
VNNNSLKLNQGEQKPNDPYTFVDKKKFSVKPKVGDNVVFTQLLISKGYWEGLNFDVFKRQEMHIVDLVIIKLNDFGNVGVQRSPSN